MIIKTSQPLLQDRKKITHKIAAFWNQISEGWEHVYGDHIHHGFYEDNQPLALNSAQEKLIAKLGHLVEIFPQNKILDIGCGLGGSSIYLAKNYQAMVTGITLSAKQVEIAQRKAVENNIDTLCFKIEDALNLASFPDESFDVVWSLESCEQFIDKKLFLQQAYRVLKPNGKLMLATWCSSEENYTDKLAKKYAKLCLAFDVPYMPTIEHYRLLLLAQNFSIKFVFDWSEFVKKSWDVGISLVKVYSFFQILKMIGWRGFRFIQQTKLMQEAFHQNRVKYGVFTATKI